jgi:two-component system, NarL family, response regulator DevR
MISSVLRTRAPAAPKPARVARVVVVEYFPLVRTAVAAALLRGEGLAVVGEAEGAAAAARLAEHAGADLVVTEVHLSVPYEGLELCRSLGALPSRPHVLVYCADRSARTVADCVAVGVDSFVHKSAGPEVLLAAARDTTLSKRCWLLGDDPTPREYRPSPGRADQDLTDREREILALLMRRLTNEEICVELCLARQTVKNHVSNVLRKLGLSSRRELHARSSATGPHVARGVAAGALERRCG